MTKRKWPKANISFEVPLYGGVVDVFFTPKKLKQAYEYLAKEDIELPGDSAGLSTEFSNETEGRRYLVGLFDKRLAFLVHELTHVALNICANAGINPQSSGGEPFCYLLDGLTERCTVGWAEWAKE